MKRIILTGKTVSRNETIKNHASKSKFHLYHVFLYDRVLTIKITEYIWSTFIWHPKIFNSLYDTGLLPTKPTERHAFLLIIFGNSHCYIAFYLCNSSSVAISSNRKKSENKLNRVWKIWLKFMGVYGHIFLSRCWFYRTFSCNINWPMMQNYHKRGIVYVPMFWSLNGNAIPVICLKIFSRFFAWKLFFKVYNNLQNKNIYFTYFWVKYLYKVLDFYSYGETS